MLPSLERLYLDGSPASATVKAAVHEALAKPRAPRAERRARGRTFVAQLLGVLHVRSSAIYSQRFPPANTCHSDGVAHGLARKTFPVGAFLFMRSFLWLEHRGCAGFPRSLVLVL